VFFWIKNAELFFNFMRNCRTMKTGTVIIFFVLIECCANFTDPQPSIPKCSILRSENLTTRQRKLISAKAGVNTDCTESIIARSVATRLRGRRVLCRLPLHVRPYVIVQKDATARVAKIEQLRGLMWPLLNARTAKTRKHGGT